MPGPLEDLVMKFTHKFAEMTPDNVRVFDVSKAQAICQRHPAAL